MIKIPQTVVDWCRQYKLCNGCKFVGSLCVAPARQDMYEEWILNLIEAIEEELNEKQ